MPTLGKRDGSKGAQTVYLSDDDRRRLEMTAKADKTSKSAWAAAAIEKCLQERIHDGKGHPFDPKAFPEPLVRVVETVYLRPATLRLLKETAREDDCYTTGWAAAAIMHLLNMRAKGGASPVEQMTLI